MNTTELREQYPSAGFYVTAPGRVNLLGEHVDYNGGVVLPVAIDRYTTLAVDPTAEPVLHATALDLKQFVDIPLDRLDAKTDTEGHPLPSWANYLAGVAWALQQSGLPTPGARVVFSSDIPMGAGLSSSAALLVAFGLMWQELGGWQMTRMDLALAGLKAENQYVGVNCGLMDQFASAHGMENHLLYFDTRSLEWHPVPLPAGMALVIANSMVRHAHSGGEYNARRAACEEALRLLEAHLPGIRTLRDVSPSDFERLAPILPEVTRKRARFVVEECVRVDQAAQELERGDVVAFGKRMLETHAGLRDLYQVSVPELDTLVEIATSLPGCYGARITGGGFGGCSINLVRGEDAPVFIEQLKAGYQQATGRQADVYLCRASQGASIIHGNV